MPQPQSNRFRRWDVGAWRLIGRALIIEPRTTLAKFRRGVRQEYELFSRDFIPFQKPLMYLGKQIVGTRVSDGLSVFISEVDANKLLAVLVTLVQYLIVQVTFGWASGMSSN